MWLNKIEERINSNIKLIKSSKNIKIETFCAESPLPILLLNNKKKIRILDFGAGSLEMPLKLAFDAVIKTNIQIDIIESKNLIKLYKKKLKKIKFPKNIKINFYEKIDFKKKYNIYHLSDSFQYVSDWKKFIKNIKKSCQNFILFNNLTAGENPTYDTIQRFYKFNISYRFFNINDIIKELKPYNLIFKSRFLNKISNKYSEYPQKNFKKKFRIGYPCSLIFKKK